MIPRRLYEHVRNHNWFAVLIDFIVVVVGVFVGVQVSNWNESVKDRSRTERVIETLRESLSDSVRVESRIAAEIETGLAAFGAARARGERPIPFVFRIPGSEMPPSSVWQAAMQSGLVDLIHPSLLFDLGFYFSERDGIAVRYIRYATFAENEILPASTPGAAAFYDENGNLTPRFAAYLDRMRELGSFFAASAASARCLEKRFVMPTEPGQSCRADYAAVPGHDPL